MTLFKRSTQGDITEGVIWKQLLAFFFPVLFGTFFQQLYNTVDAMVVGKYVGKEALAAVGGATGNMINLIVGFFVGLSSGATVIIAQFYGSRNGKDLNRTVHNAIALSLTGGVALMIFGFILAPQLLELMDTPAEVMDYAVQYMRIYFLGMIPSLIYNIGSGILRAIGDSRRPLYFLIASCVTNIILDVVFVVGFELEVRGAAIATIISQTVSAVLVIVTLYRSNAEYQLRFKKIRFHGDILKSVIRIGLPAGIQSVMYSLSNVIIQTCVNGFGTDILSGWTAYGKMDGLFWMTISSFGVAITTFVGQNFGAGKIKRVKQSVRTCLMMAAGATIFMSAVILIFSRTLLGLFTTEEAVLDWGQVIITTLVPTYITYVCVEVFSCALHGAGDTLIPTLMTFFGICVMRTVWVTFFIPTHHELNLLLLIYPISWIVTSILLTVYFLRGKWTPKCAEKMHIKLTE